MRYHLITGCLIAVLAALAPAQGGKSKTGPGRDWGAIPKSALPARLTGLCTELCNRLPKGLEPKFVVTPFQCGDGRINTWRIEAYVHRLVQRELKRRGHAVVDLAPFLVEVRSAGRQRQRRSKGRAATASPGALPKLKYGSKLIGRAAATTGANIVVVGSCKFGGKKSHITLRSYGGSPRRRLASKTLSIASIELDLRRNTPDTNRQVIAWVEQHYGNKIDRGECWDLANRAFASLGIRRAGGSTKWGELIAPGQAILPGDIIQWNRQETGGRHHTVVVYDVARRGQIKVLHQNWAGGAERGRKVGPGSYTFAGLGKGRVYRPIPPAR